MKILLAVDQTQQAEEAVRAVGDCFPRAEVEILHVLDIEAIPHSHLSAALIDRYHQKIRAQLQTAANTFLPRMMTLLLQVAGRVRVLVREGRASDVILKTAVSSSPDLIVLGSRGLSGVQAWLLGGVSYRVARKAPYPVLLCKHLLPRVPKLLLVIDRTQAAERAMWLLTEQRLFPSSHVVVLLVGRSFSAHEEVLNRVTVGLSARGFSVDARLLTTIAPTRRILECAEKEAIDIIIIGTLETSGWWRRWMGGTFSHTVMMTAPISVLVMHDKGARQ